MDGFKEIRLQDKALFDKYFFQSRYNSSEMTFTNFFMWRNFYKFRFVECENMLCIISTPEGKAPFAFLPLGEYIPNKFRETVMFIKDYFHQNGWELVFKRIEEENVQYFQECTGLTSDVVFDRDSSDYVYLTEDMINLKGKKFHSKRNHINSFHKLYKYEYVVLSEEYINECIRINEEWCMERDCEDHREFYCEKIANNEVLRNISTLGCKGALIKVNDRFESYTVGEMLNEDTAVIHIEKANSSIRGLYTVTNQLFCENQWKNTLYINREQDIGVEGLRKAKLSYNPVKMVNKYSVYVR